MHWSKKLLTFQGVDVCLHASTFWLLMWLIPFVYVEVGWVDAAKALGQALLVLLGMLTGEFAVALRLRYLGIQPQSITLLPFGSVTQLSRWDLSRS